jgi:hypothetical protein
MYKKLCNPRKCGIYIQWNFIHPQRKMKFCNLQVNRWNWRTSSYVKLIRFRRPNVTCFLLYVPGWQQIIRKTNHMIIGIDFLLTQPSEMGGKPIDRALLYGCLFNQSKKDLGIEAQWNS